MSDRPDAWARGPVRRRDVLAGTGLVGAGLLGAAGVRGRRGASTGDVRAEDLVDGYPDRTAYLPGDVARLYLSTWRRIDHARLPLTDVLGRTVDLVRAPVLGRQLRREDRPYERGYGYRDAVEYRIPHDLPSGVYTLFDKVVLTVRPRPGGALPLAVLPLSTMQAYNTSGGKSLYLDAETRSATERARVVSLRRPLPTWELSDARQLLRWAARHDVDLAVTTDVDLSAQDLRGRRLVLLIGHNEYWTRAARQLFDGFVDAGGNALVLSGNTMWWQSRVQGDQLVCHRSRDLDPLGDGPQATILWESLGWSPIRSVGASFEHGGYSHQGLSRRAYTVVDRRHPLLDGVPLGLDGVVRLVDDRRSAWLGQTIEYDGVPVRLDPLGRPVTVDPAITSAHHRYQLVAYDYGFRSRRTYMTLVDLQRTPTSGRVVNFANNVIGRSLTTSEDRDLLTTMARNALGLLGGG